jgi:hypothetical protein
MFYYRYYIIYEATKNNIKEKGVSEIIRKGRIKTWNDIQEIRVNIKTIYKFQDLIILDWKLLKRHFKEPK